eukprot:6186696-Pleurochrysis_carterae.AAC.1
MHFTPATLKAAHQRVFGNHTAKLPEAAADGIPLYDCEIKSKQTQKIWRELILSFISFSATADRDRIELFFVESFGPVCESFCRKAYGVPESTWKTYLSHARAGTLRSEHELRLDTD